MGVNIIDLDAPAAKGYKLGKQTGSVINFFMGNATTGTEPEVGVGVTLLSWTDRTAGTIIAATPNVIVVQEDAAKRLDSNGMSESQHYEFSPDPSGRISVFTKRRNGQYTLDGCKTGEGNGLLIGHREKYHDYSF